MGSISGVSSATSVYQSSRVTSSQSEQFLKPADDSRQGKDGGGLLGAIDSALKEAGVSGGLSSIFGDSESSALTAKSTDESEASNGTDSTESAREALDSFLQNLMATLQSQGGVEKTDEGESRSIGDMPPPPPSPIGYGGESVSEKLQNLISQLSDSDTTSSSDSSDSSNTELETSFANLLSALGGSTSDTSDLQAFLEALSSNLEGQYGSSGILLKTAA